MVLGEDTAKDRVDRQYWLLLQRPLEHNSRSNDLNLVTQRCLLVVPVHQHRRCTEGSSEMHRSVLTTDTLETRCQPGPARKAASFQTHLVRTTAPDEIVLRLAFGERSTSVVVGHPSLGKESVGLRVTCLVVE